VNKYLYIGKESREFFRHYGARNHQLVYTPYAVDNDYFNEHYYSLKHDVKTLRNKLHLPLDKKIILFSGKYISKKRPMDLLKAFNQLQDDNAILLMVGEGELRGEMESFIKEYRLNNVMLTGFVNQSTIPEYYMAADVFVMCSGEGETWGLAVNEAMNFAKPVIVSSICGCSDDLVHHGRNGFVFAKGDFSALTTYLRRILADDNFRARAGYLSKQIVGAYSIAKIVTNLSNAAQPKTRILRPIRTIYRLILKYRSVGIY
jgi:glycosyltransferase involved in cell wall biosynthesis